MHCKLDTTRAKGWFIGPWNSVVDIPIGYANQAVDEPHSHSQMHEVYLVARGQSTALVDGKTFVLRSGDMLVVEPGEMHTFTAYTPDYLHFVLQTPFVKGDKNITPESKPNLCFQADSSASGAKLHLQPCTADRYRAGSSSSSCRMA